MFRHPQGQVQCDFSGRNMVNLSDEKVMYMVAARVRGIYSTALVRLLLDHGYEVAETSAAVATRFGLEDIARDHDLDILDRRDRQGVLALGTSQSVEAFRAVLCKDLFDVVMRTPRSPISNVWRISLDFEFPGYSKHRLDEIRGYVTPTIQGHHQYKACGGNIASAVDMAENLLAEGRPQDEVERLFTETIGVSLPAEGVEIEIDHIKLDGQCFHLGTARVDSFNRDEGSMRLHRPVKGGGLYDGLKVEKSPGDYAITEVRIGEWYLATRYFSREGILKGTYVNVNTPVELYPDRLRYVDLEADICIWPNGDIRVLDMRYLKEAVAEGLINNSLLPVIQQKMDDLLKEKEAYTI